MEYVATSVRLGNADVLFSLELLQAYTAGVISEFSKGLIVGALYCVSSK